jgi:hypothetical protein
MNIRRLFLNSSALLAMGALGGLGLPAQTAS